MGSPATGLLLLALAAAVGLAGVWVLVSEAGRRAAIAGAQDDGEDRALAALLDRRLRRSSRGQRLTVWLQSAGLGLTAGQFVLRTAFAAVATYLVASIVVPSVIALIAAGVAVAAAANWVGRKREQRRFEFIAQLPDVARLLSNGSSAGLAMAASLELAAGELDEPASSELSRVVDEMRMGRTLDDALADLQRRLPSREAAVLITTMAIQQRAGGDVVRALQDLAAALEARKYTLREVRTLMSGAVARSYLVAGMGVATVLLMSVMGGNALGEMTSSPLGLLVLAVSTIVYAFAFVLIRQTTRIDV